MRSHDGAHPDRRGCGHARPRGGAGARRGRFRLGRGARRLRARACRARRPPSGPRGRAAGQAGNRFGRPPLIAPSPSPSRRGVIRAITAGAAAALWPATVAGARSPVIAPAVRLRRGVNLWPWFSLTREFPPPRTDYDWPPLQADRPVPTRGDLAALRAAGIDFVRLPVDPGPLLAFAGERRAALLAQVMGAIETAIAEDLAVVLNLHPNGATHYWTPRNLMRGPADPMFARYLDLVAVVAARLDRMDPSRVAFEPLNEPPQDCTSADLAGPQLRMVRAARSAAPRHTLILTGACGSMIAGLEALQPIDDPNIIYTFHFYEPYVFSHQGAPWMMTSEPMYRYLNAVPWPNT